MSITVVIVLLGGLLLTALVGWHFGSKRSRMADLEDGTQVRRLFERQESGDCTSRVALPDFRINQVLPAFAPTTVDFMATEPTGRGLGRGMQRVLCASLLSVLMVLGSAASASASEGEESERASDLVQQSIALIANRGGVPRVLEKIEDAVNASDPTGVDLAKVEQALAIVQGLDVGTDEVAAFAEARRLLVESTPQLATEPADLTEGLETGTTTVLDALEPARGVRGGGDVTLLLLSLAAVGVGVWMSVRLRPKHTIRQLRHLSVTGTTGPDPEGSDAP